MPLILVIQPDAAQADVLFDVLVDRIDTRIEVVATKDDAVCAIAREVPDLILITTLMSPRDEEALVSHLRALDDAARPQMVLVPTLERPIEQSGARPSRFSLRRKPAAPVVTGCDPTLFVDQVRTYLQARERVRMYEAVLESPLPAAAMAPPIELPMVESDEWPPIVPEEWPPIVPEEWLPPVADAVAEAEMLPAASPGVEQRNMDILARLQADAETRGALAVVERRDVADIDARIQDVMTRMRMEVEAVRAAEQAEAVRREELVRAAAAEDARVAVAEARAAAEYAASIAAEQAAQTAAERAARAVAEETARAAAEQAAVAAAEAKAAAAAEQAASTALTIEVAQLRTEWEARLLSEVARVREEAGQQHASAFVALRAQIADLRRRQLTAAYAAPVAPVASAFAPGASADRPANVFVGEVVPEPKWTVPSHVVARPKQTWVAPPVARRTSRPALPPAASAARSVRQHPWALPIAAALAIMTGGGVGIRLGAFNPLSWAHQSAPAATARAADIHLAAPKPVKRTRKPRATRPPAPVVPAPAADLDVREKGGLDRPPRHVDVAPAATEAAALRD